MRPAHLDVAHLDRHVERRQLPAVSAVDVGAVRQQQPHEARAARRPGRCRAATAAVATTTLLLLVVLLLVVVLVLVLVEELQRQVQRGLVLC